MRHNIAPKRRKELANKIGKALEQETKLLPEDMQKILADDLVTAFFNRLEVLTKPKGNQANHDMVVQFSNETIEVSRAS